jgi:small-conductance mechanosensitive channel
MTDPDDLMLTALFQHVDDNQAFVSGPAFTQRVMARVNEMHAKRKVLVDTLLWTLVACVAVICIVLAPSAWPQIEASWVKNTAAFGLGGQSLSLIGILLLSGLGWAMAVRD